MADSSFCSARSGGAVPFYICAGGDGPCAGETKKKAQRRDRQFPAVPNPCSRLKGSFYLVLIFRDTTGTNVLFSTSIYHMDKNFSTNFRRIFRKSPNGTENPPCFWGFCSYGSAFCTICFRGVKRAENRPKSGVPGRAHRFFQTESMGQRRSGGLGILRGLLFGQDA